MIIKSLIKHRVNTIEMLKETPSYYGIEFDLRPYNDKIVMHHDPFVQGDDFSAYLDEYHHEIAILNTKAEGMEGGLIQMMAERSIDNYFFLDLSIPFLVKTIKGGCSKVAIRFSEFEPIEFVSKFAGMAEWVWVDCFTKNTLTENAYHYLKQHFKICVVSPELQAHPYTWINDFKTAYNNFEIDAVCTKVPELWK